MCIQEQNKSDCATVYRHRELHFLPPQDLNGHRGAAADRILLTTIQDLSETNM